MKIPLEYIDEDGKFDAIKYCKDYMIQSGPRTVGELKTYLVRVIDAISTCPEEAPTLHLLIWSLCYSIISLSNEMFTVTTKADRVKKLLTETIPALQAFANDNPMWYDIESGKYIDPCGVNELLKRIRELQ